MSINLNFAQQEAVNFLHGPCLVLAGAGSGKTRVITHKIARLIQTGLDPKRIAAITFTNKAAAEMRERTKTLIGHSAKHIFISTFHALGAHILRQDGNLIGLKPQFSIIDSVDVANILKDIGGTKDTAIARQWQWTISLWKNMGLNSAKAQAQAKDDSEYTIAKIMACYEARLAAYQCVDFDDLLNTPLKLLQEFDTTRSKWQTELDYVLVDEYQDTNATQYELLKCLVGPDSVSSRFTAVGDDDQSIYGWRGATLDNLRRLPQDFPNLKIIKLEQNYRSTSSILQAANNVIQLNPKLFPKTLFSQLGEGEPIHVIDADTEEHEADRIVTWIQSLHLNSNNSHGHCALQDFAILYRANHQSRVIEIAMRKAEIPYKVSGGQSFFDRSEIRDLCAWLRLLVNTNDDPAFLRAITTPKRGVGHKTLVSLANFSRKYKLSLFEALQSSSLPSVLGTRIVDNLHEFGRYINDLEFRARFITGVKDARTFLTTWLENIKYENHLYNSEESNKVALSKWTNVMEFCDWIAHRCREEINNIATISPSHKTKNLLEVIQTVALLSTSTEREKDKNAVTLSTLHASKGLEWPHVALVGVTEGMLPFCSNDELEQKPTSINTSTRLEEERRLMYVGITRAQSTLTISWPRKRKKGREIITAIPSRFIAEMQLDKKTLDENPREKLKALRNEFAQYVS